MGGIHPPDRKRQTRHLPTRNAVIPQTSVVPLLQHVGAPAVPRVGPGDRVREGMLIGQSQGPGGAGVHSPVPGVVREVTEITLPGGARSAAIVIDTEGEFDRLGKSSAVHEWQSIKPATILRIIAENGVVAMGGLPEPAHLAYSAIRARQCKVLILNGSESEPYLCADHRVMVERASMVLSGLQIVARLLTPDRIVVAIEANKPDAIGAMTGAIRELGLPYRVVRLQVKYPQGDDRQLIRAVTGREIPSGGRPIDIGCLTLGVATAVAIHDAVVHRNPLIERVVTVTGGAIARPANIKARIGTPIGRLIEECGGFASVPARIVVGGPLMGHTVTDLRTPITKSTGGIVALTDREVRQAVRSPCIQCGRCVQACPMGLNPTRLHKLIDHHDVPGAVSEGLLDCTECGSCGYICPSRIPLVQGMRIGKARVEGRDG